MVSKFVGVGEGETHLAAVGSSYNGKVSDSLDHHLPRSRLQGLPRTTTTIRLKNH